MAHPERIDLDRLTTEARNPRSTELDRLDTLDTAECPPTFNAEPGQVIGLIAGGETALTRAVEGAEDDAEAGAAAVRALEPTAHDVVVGITASGRAPWVLGALDAARDAGAFAIGFACNAAAELQAHADLCILPVTGPEVLSGSTRMKAGTATKMVLNMLTTGAMVRLGKTYGNLMVDVQATNEKLVERALRIVQTVTDCDRAEARQALAACDGKVKPAIVMLRLGIDADAADDRLRRAGGQLRAALGERGRDG
ncbi:MAG: N-acetylmuramic acid 6-phosphate etherase [Xanthomonadales bacterium]